MHFVIFKTSWLQKEENPGEILRFSYSNFLKNVKIIYRNWKNIWYLNRTSIKFQNAIKMGQLSILEALILQADIW